MMHFKKIKLTNIRSYTDAEISFPQGTVLLSGDIGSGKSTILLAIDFALFGISKDLSGASLLRNGASNGAVDLHFSVDGRDVIVTRRLKRGHSVTQDYGSLTIDSARRELTATELKHSILDLLAYPKDLLTRSTSFVYRYTMYTPQEEMKAILLGNTEQRLETLRKVFAVDKYKRIIMNIDIFASHLKSLSRTYAALITGLADQQQRFHELEDKIIGFTDELLTLQLDVERLLAQTTEKKSALHDLELRLKEVNELKKNLSVLDVSIHHNRQNEQTCQHRLTTLARELQVLQQQASFSSDIPQGDLSTFTQNLAAQEANLRQIRDTIQEIKTTKRHRETIHQDLQRLDVCPVCQQAVSRTYKQEIIERDSPVLIRYDRELAAALSREQDLFKTVSTLRETIDALKARDSRLQMHRLTQQLHDQKRSEQLSLEKQRQDHVRELVRLQTEHSLLSTHLERYATLDREYSRINLEFEQSLHHQQQRELDKVSLEKEISYLRQQHHELQETIAMKKKYNERVTLLAELHDWLISHLTPLLSLMERHILLKVHQDFDSFFQKWFGLLIDTENISIHLDQEFTPRIEQNGHDIDYLFLSGGEKTAVALAYRLALHHVINSLLSTIKTRDILILDEPTDGFSNEQVDRLRLVLDELPTKQIILVSHDSKIESFVDHVIRLEKKEHVSTVFS